MSRVLLACLVALGLLWAGPAYAAIIFLEAGTNATYDVKFWYAPFSGGISSSTDQAHTGSRSLKVNVDGSEANSNADVLADAGRRISAYVYMTGTQNPTHIMKGQAADTTIVWKLEIIGGALQLLDRFGAQIGSNGTVVPGTNAWTRLAVSYTMTSTTVNAFKVYVGGTLSINATNSTVDRTGTSRLVLAGGTGTAAYWSDIYVDDGSDLADPGDIRVTAKLPAANNTNSFDTAIGANPANRWTNVNERALSETNGWRHAATTNVQENFTLQTAAVGDVDLSSGVTLVGRSAWIWAKGTAGGAGTPKIMDNGTETAVVLTNAAKLFAVLTASASYPSDAAGIGIRSTNNADDTFLYECGTLIAYTPAIAAPVRHRINVH